MNNGWISIHRKLLDWEWYSDKNTRLLFMHCLLLANYEDSYHRGILIKKGSFKTGRHSLSNGSGLTIQQTRTSLDKLMSTNEITMSSTPCFSIISITNWAEYQNANQSNNQPNHVKTPTTDQPANQPQNNHQINQLNNQQINQPETKKSTNHIESEATVNIDVFDINIKTPTTLNSENQPTNQPVNQPANQPQNNQQINHRITTDNNIINKQVNNKTIKQNNIDQFADLYFFKFWDLYPKKVAKQECLRFWKTKKLEKLGSLIIENVTERLKYDSLWKNGYAVNPLKFLKGSRWEDEIILKKHETKKDKAEKNKKIAEEVLKNINSRNKPTEKIITGERL